MRFKAVIFDFGGVFTTSPINNFAKYEKENGLPKRFLGNVIKRNHHTNAFAQFERSEIDLDSFDRMFAEESAAAGFEVSGRTLVGLLSFSVHQEMVDALRGVKSAGLKTGCITNNIPQPDLAHQSHAHSLSMQTVAEIFSLFDQVIESSKAGIRKPEPRIYEMMCEALAVAPGECVFLDDLGINLKPARQMGMATIKVPFEDVRPAITELYRLLKLA